MVADVKVVENQPSGVQPYVQLKRNRSDKVQPTTKRNKTISAPRSRKEIKLHWKFKLVKRSTTSDDIENTETLEGPSCPDAIAFGVL